MLLCNLLFSGYGFVCTPAHVILHNYSLFVVAWFCVQSLEG